jgi:hypothetical protein
MKFLIKDSCGEKTIQTDDTILTETGKTPCCLPMMQNPDGTCNPDSDGKIVNLCESNPEPTNPSSGIRNWETCYSGDICATSTYTCCIAPADIESQKYTCRPTSDCSIDGSTVSFQAQTIDLTSSAFDEKNIIIVSTFLVGLYNIYAI